MVAQWSPSPGRGTPHTHPIDWRAARLYVSRRLRQLLPRLDAADLEDLAHEALIDLLRTSRREPVRNVEALLNVLAKRKVIDSVRRRERWGALIDPGPPDTEPAAPARPAPDWLSDPAERVAFVVLEFFARGRSECEALAKYLLAGHEWAAVAAATGRTEVAVRKQWSRCVAQVRRALAERPEAMWSWMDDRGGNGDDER